MEQKQEEIKKPLFTIEIKVFEKRQEFKTIHEEGLPSPDVSKIIAALEIVKYCILNNTTKTP